jgi:hypothetical protein
MWTIKATIFRANKVVFLLTHGKSGGSEFLISNCDSTALVDLGRYFSFLIVYTVSKTSNGGSARRKAATYTQNNTNTE